MFSWWFLRSLISLTYRMMKLLCSLAIQKADSEDSDQSVRMHRLIWILAGRTCPMVCFYVVAHFACTGNYFIFTCCISRCKWSLSYTVWAVYITETRLFKYIENFTSKELNIFSGFVCGACSVTFFSVLVPREVCSSRLAFLWYLLFMMKTCLFKNTENFTTKQWKFSDKKKKKKKKRYFSRFCSKHRLWVLVRTASARRF